MNNTKTLFVTPNEKLLCIKGTEHLFSVCHKTSDFVTETVAENIEEKTAHLFAAAPDLVSALEAFVDNVEQIIGLSDFGNPSESDFPLNEAREALRKAKGEA